MFVDIWLNNVKSIRSVIHPPIPHPIVISIPSVLPVLSAKVLENWRCFGVMFRAFGFKSVVDSANLSRPRSLSLFHCPFRHTAKYTDEL